MSLFLNQIYIYIYIYMSGAFSKFSDFLYMHLELSLILENLICYFFIYYEMADKFLWFQVQINNYIRN